MSGPGLLSGKSTNYLEQIPRGGYPDAHFQDEAPYKRQSYTPSLSGSSSRKIMSAVVLGPPGATFGACTSRS